MLRAFAGQVDVAAAAITNVNIGRTVSSAADGLPGSTTQWAVRTASPLACNVRHQLGRSFRAVIPSGIDVKDNTETKRRTRKAIVFWLEIGTTGATPMIGRNSLTTGRRSGFMASGSPPIRRPLWIAA
jgi:hypothetical protein